MEPVLYSVPILLTVALLFVFAVARTFAQLWAIHRRKVGILQKYEQDPRAFASSQEVLDQMSEQEQLDRRTVRQDYAITGTCLAAIGLTAVFVGRLLGYGEAAVGLYIGGIGCIGLGLLVALLGYLVRALTRPLHSR